MAKNTIVAPRRRTAEEKERERRAGVILDGMYQFVALLNPKGDILEANRAALEGAGHRIEEIRGKPFWTARWWQVSERVKEELKAAIQRAAAGEFVRYEVDIYGEQSGLAPITIDFSLQPIRGASGEVEYLLAEGRNITERPVILLSARAGEELRAEGVEAGSGINIDITDRKRAEEAKAHLAAIVESSDDAIISKDLRGMITSWNRGAEKLFGYTAEEAIGKSITMLIPQHRLDEEPEILRRISRGERVEHYETVRRRKDGSLIDISLSVSPIVDSMGHIIGASKIAHDITDRKHSEAALRRWQEELERRVSERTRALEQSEYRLRALATELNLAEQRERKRLSADLHDYLAQLLVLCRITLAQAKRTGLPPRSEDFIKETEETLGKALTYCRTLMTELNPPVLQEQGLPAGLIWLGDYMKRQEVAVTVEIQEGLDVPVPEDRAVLLFQSVRELLINVAKHGAVKKAAVRMTCQDGSLHIVVSDENGFDLAAAAAATADTSPVSSKFGLFSIRERMKALGGTFDIQSAPGQGTTATLTLPVATSVTEGGMRNEKLEVVDKIPGVRSQESDHSTFKMSHSSFQQDAKRIRVLLVDDHTLVRQGLRSIVAAYNHLEVVGEAGGGAEAVELAQQLHPDVIVMDINMRNMDGIEATKHIKRDQPDIAVIGLSVQQSADTEQRMKAAGAIAYLTKESAADVLCHAIEEAVSYKVSNQ